MVFTPVGERASDERPLPEWAADVDVTAPRRRAAVAVVARAAAGIAVAIALWLVGRRVPAIVLAGLLSAVTASALLFPAVANKLNRATGAVERIAGRILSFVLLSVVHLVVFTPLWLALVLLRIDPLALGGRARAASLWRPTATPAGRPPLYRRQFGYEHPASDAPDVRRPALRRLRTALAVVCLLALLDVGLGAALHAVTDSSRAAAGPRQSLLLNPRAAASRNQPWLGTLAHEIDQVWYGKRYDPYLGWTLPSYSGVYLHTSGGERRSYEPPGSAGPRALKVWFFGGSTTFGLFQRDQYTIASDFARLAAADGIPVRVSNYGQLAYNNWQEVLLLEELFSARHRPSLAVFYDGANELVGQFRLGPHPQPSQQEAGEFAKRIGLVGQTASSPQRTSSQLGGLYRSWKDVSALVWLWRTLRGLPTDQQQSSLQPLVSPWAGNQQQEAAAGGRDAASVLARGVDVARAFASGAGFHTAFFLQPFLYSKPPLPGEQQEVGSLGTDPVAWRHAYAVLRAALSPAVVDISNAFDQLKSPIFYDFVHTNEFGAEVVARNLYARLKPMLERLYRGSRG